MRLRLATGFSEVKWGALARAWRRFGPHVKRYRGRLLGAFGFLLLAMLMILAKPWPLMIVFDHVLPAATGRVPELPPYLSWLITLDGEKTSAKGPLDEYSVEDGTLRFGSLELELRDETELLDEAGQALAASSFAKGQRVKLRFSVKEDGRLELKRMQRLGGKSGSRRLRGSVEELLSQRGEVRRFSVLGVVVEADADTSWKGLSVPAVGAWVDTEGSFDSAGVFHAEEVRRPDPVHLLWLAGLAVIVFAVLEGLFNYCQKVLAARVAHKVVFRVRSDVFAHVQRLPLAFHDRRQTGDLLMRMTGDIQALREILVQSIIVFAGRVIVVVGMLAIMVTISPTLTLAAFVVLPTVALLLIRFSGRIREVSRKQRRKEGKIASIISETLHAIPVVQSFAANKQEDERLAKANRSSLRAGLKATRLEERMAWVVEVAMAVGTCTVLFLGTSLALRGAITPGHLLVFLAYVRGMYKPLRKLSRLSARLAKAAACAERLLELLELDRPQSAPRDALSAEGLRGQIEYKGVSLRYEGETTDALRGVDLKVAAGETVLLHGGSGAGKTSLVRLLLRLYDPSKGSVLIDGQDVRSYDLEELRDRIAIVLQEPILFASSIRENIAYGKPDASDEEIREAARRAHAHDFIEGLSDGYATMVGEKGLTLSGGQRQRIALARAAIREPAILILDEPMTGLDPEAAAAVREGLQGILGRATTLIISHAPDTFEDVDRIIELGDGAIRCIGTSGPVAEVTPSPQDDVSHG